jgi:hypothetical protein
MSEQRILIEALSVKQALKFFLLKEKSRHVQDILKIDEDLRRLKEVQIPEDIELDTWIEV